jgi:hypothetical protein
LEASPYAPELPGIWDLLGCRKNDTELVRLIRDGFASEFGTVFATEDWNETELERIEEISQKF